MHNQRKNREKRVFLTSIRHQNRENPIKKPSKNAQSCSVSKKPIKRQNDFPKYGQCDKKSRLSSIYSGIKNLSVFTIQLLIAQNLR